MRFVIKLRGPISFAEHGAVTSYRIWDHVILARLVCDLFLLLLGGPLNLLASLRLVKQFKKIRRKRETAMNLLLLKTNLHISDLLIIFVHLPFDIVWQWTVSWNGGDVLCKFHKFVSIFAFHLSSFAILSIAAERTLTVRKIVAVFHGSTSASTVMLLRTTSVKVFLIGTWVVSIALSSPQIFFWRDVEIVSGFHQCTTYVVDRLVQLMNDKSPENILAMNASIEHAKTMRIIFEMSCLGSIFWLPACLITAMYIYVFVQLRRFGKVGETQTPRVSAAECSFLPRVGTKYSRTENTNYDISVDMDMQSSAKNMSSPTKNRLSLSSLQNGNGCYESLPTRNLSSGNKLSVPNVELKKVPKWRSELRSGRKIFSQTGLLVLTYLVCWFPYYLAASFPYELSTLQVLIVLNSAVNPILYAFD